MSAEILRNRLGGVGKVWKRGPCGLCRAFSSYPAIVRRHAGSDSRIALLAPQQAVSWSYAELDERCRRLARGLREIGFGPGSVAVSGSTHTLSLTHSLALSIPLFLTKHFMFSDVGNTPENLVLQLALSHLGASIATVKDADSLAALRAHFDVRGAIVTSAAEGFLPGAAAEQLKLPSVCLDAAEVGKHSGRVLFYEEIAASPPCTQDAACTDESLMGSYGGSRLTQGAACALGRAAASELAMTHMDRACISITLCHAFGIGSAVGSALLSQAAIVLPAVGGIRGCGDPAQRAKVTRDVLSETSATLVFADSHTLHGLDALPPPPEVSKLRGGVVKVGSGGPLFS